MEHARAPLCQFACAAALAFCVMGAGVAQAEVPAEVQAGAQARQQAGAPEQIAQMHVVAMPLRDVLTWFSQETGLAISAPDGLGGRVVDVRLVARTADFTRWLARDFGLDHYRNGNTLYLSPADESVRHMLTLDAVPLAQLQQGVAALDVAAAVPLGAGDPTVGAVLVAGPAAYVAVVESVLDGLKASRALQARIVVNRGGVLTVEDLDARRRIVSILPAPPAAQTVQD